MNTKRLRIVSFVRTEPTTSSYDSYGLNFECKNEDEDGASWVLPVKCWEKVE